MRKYNTNIWEFKTLANLRRLLLGENAVPTLKPPVVPALMIKSGCNAWIAAYVTRADGIVPILSAPERNGSGLVADKTKQCPIADDKANSTTVKINSYKTI